MWALTHNILSSTEPGIGGGDVKCSCGWVGKPPEVREHLDDASRERQEKIAEFVRMMDDLDDWNLVNSARADAGYMTPEPFVATMRLEGHK